MEMQHQMLQSAVFSLPESSDGDELDEATAALHSQID